ncbi:MAG: glycosyltransferase family 2 protein [Actinomycetota bacterium]|nr:glycosyltransferase family 2 protein [Actinomycetota bacterium]
MAQVDLAADAVLPSDAGSRPHVSLVIPVYNEEGTIGEVYRRSAAALDGDGRPWEIVFVDDGSTDGTWAVLEAIHREDPNVRVVRFKRNFGQHPAMHAGIVRARGDVVVTMDADLQNSPADIVKLVHAVDAGSDVASGRRTSRGDSWGRRLPSKLVNRMLRSFTKADIADFGCAFNAYRRDVLLPMSGSIGKQKFTKALVLSTGASVVEVDIGHQPRAGRSRYTWLGLARVALHVVAGFWPQPIQWAGMIIGVASSLLAGAAAVWAAVFWVVRDDFPGPLFLAALVLAILGIQGFIFALVGEYLGRLQRDVEGRPLYTVASELDKRRSHGRPAAAADVD